MRGSGTKSCTDTSTRLCHVPHDRRILRATFSCPIATSFVPCNSIDLSSRVFGWSRQLLLPCTFHARKKALIPSFALGKRRVCACVSVCFYVSACVWVYVYFPVCCLVMGKFLVVGPAVFRNLDIMKLLQCLRDLRKEASAAHLHIESKAPRGKRRFEREKEVATRRKRGNPHRVWILSFQNHMAE